MATFTGQLISATYDAILKSIDNDPLGSIAKQITDGLGNVTPLYISTTQIGIGITPTEALHVSGNIIGTGTLAITGLTTFGTLKSNLATGATIGEFITEAQGIAANNNDTTLPTSAAVKDYVDSGNTGQVTGSGTGGKLPIWTGIGASSTLSDSAITEESTRFVLTKDIFINEGIPVLTLSDSNSTGSATLGDIIWQDNTATQRAIISLYNNNLAITSKQGGLTFGTASTTAMTIDATQNAIFNSDLDVTGDFAVNTDKFTVNAVNGNSLVAGTLGVTSTLTSADITTGNITAANGIFSGGITANGTSVTNTFKSTVLINRVGQQSTLLIGSNSIDDVVIGFQTDGNSMSMGIDRSDSNAFKISDSNGGLGTNDRFKIDTTGAAFFTGLVSGITPTAAANFVTKEYIDGGGGAGSGFLPLAGGTLTGALTGTTAGFSGSITASGNSNTFGNTTIGALSASTGTFSGSVTATGNSNSFGTTTFGGNVTISQPTNGADADLILVSKSSGGNSRTSYINWDADAEKLKTYVSGTLATTIDSAGNVGIGTASPSSYYSDDLVVKVPDEGGITIANNPNQLGYLMFADGTTGSEQYRGQVAYDHDGDIMSFATSGTGRMAITGAGNLVIGAAITADAKVDILGLDLNIGADNGAPTTRTNSTVKVGVITSPHYTTAEENFTGMLFVGNTTVNEVAIGGGTSTFNSATQIKFYTGANSTTVLGTEKMRITSGGQVGIGGIVPSQQLELGGILSPALKLTSTTTNGGVIIFNVAGADKGFFGSGYHLGTGSSNDTAIRGESDIVFLSGGNNQRMRITAGTGAGEGSTMINYANNAIQTYGSGAYSAKLIVKAHTTTPNAAITCLNGNIGGDNPVQLNFVNEFVANQYNYIARIIAAPETNWGGTASTRNSSLNFHTNNVGSDSEKMRITSNGGLKLGMAVWSGAPSSTIYGLKFETSATGKSYWRSYVNAATSHYHYEFGNTNGMVGNITSSGTATGYNSVSDYRLKENVVPMTSALDRVSQLKPSRFNFIADEDKTVDGFLAHEVQEVVPEAINGEKDAMKDEEYEVSAAVYEDVIHPAIEEELDDEENVITEAKEEWTENLLVSEAVKETREVPDYQGIDQSKLVPLLVAAIQELKAEIDSLKAQVNS